MRLLLVVVVVSLGCTKPNPKSCLDNHCSDPDLPFCDVDGAIGGEPNTCIAVDCSPGTVASCRDDRALTCNATGNNFDLVACEYGCDAAAGGCLPCNTSDCEQHVIPKYVATVCNQLSAYPTLSIAVDTMLDTSVDLACSAVVTQATGPAICVLHYNTVAIERNQVYSVTGSRALALVADRDLTIDGVLAVSGVGTASGPAGGINKSGTGMMNVSGGGAGYRHAGGAGATTTTDGGANNGGAAAQTGPAQLAELFGGTQPTQGTNARPPGGAGGGVTLVSCRGTLSVPGTIDAGGGGGLGGRVTVNPITFESPSGGGAGGTVVLQGLHVNVTGELFANGGGGGAGGSNGGTGENGTRSTTAAKGGVAGFDDGGAGGAGGTIINPGVGKAHSQGGGAGGGSSGFFLVYTPAPNPPTLTPLMVSPGIEPKGNIATNN